MSASVPDAHAQCMHLSSFYNMSYKVTIMEVHLLALVFVFMHTADVDSCRAVNPVTTVFNFSFTNNLSGTSALLSVVLNYMTAFINIGLVSKIFLWPTDYYSDSHLDVRLGRLKGCHTISKANPKGRGAIDRNNNITVIDLCSARGTGFFSLTGIPYAEPPVGNLRFLPARPLRYLNIVYS